MSKHDRLAASISLSELALNAIEHSNAADQQVFIQFEHCPDSLVITVRDHGKKEPSPPQKPLRPFRGNGLKVVRALCDRVEIRPSRIGFCIAITKNLWRPQIGGFSI